MKKIGIISDTHGYWDDRYLKYFEPCDEIWHAGDIGTMEIAERLAAFRPLRAVHGNIDGGDLRRMYPEILRGCRCTYEAHRRLSGQLRPLRTGHDLCFSASTFYQRTLSHLKDKVRSYTEFAPYKSGCRRYTGLAEGTHVGKTDDRRQQIHRLRGYIAVRQAMNNIAGKTE